jgi:hypothetical protein
MKIYSAPGENRRDLNLETWILRTVGEKRKVMEEDAVAQAQLARQAALVEQYNKVGRLPGTERERVFVTKRERR